MLDILNGDKGPFQMLFGEDASLNPAFILPIIGVVFVVLVIIAMRVIINDKGRSEMSEEELEKDRALYDGRMERQAAFDGKEYVPDLARAAEANEIAEAKRRYGKATGKLGRKTP